MSGRTAAAREAARTRRTQLFVPATRPSFVAKAAASGADAVVLDLEDSVRPAEKEPARDALGPLVAALRSARSGLHVLVRVNAGIGRADDVDAVVAAGADGVLVPKVEGPHDVLSTQEELHEAEARHGLAPGALELQLLVESPRGLLAVADIAAAGEHVVALMLGVEDLSTSLEIDPASPDFDIRWAHGMVVCAARAHGLAAYGLLGSLASYADLDGLRRDARRARAFGYSGTLCIHPAQVPVLNAAFSPTAEEVEAARTVLRAFDDGGGASGGAAVGAGGRMVDSPVAQRARLLLSRAERLR